MSTVTCGGRGVAGRVSHAPTLIGRNLFWSLRIRNRIAPATAFSITDNNMLEAFNISSTEAVVYAVVLLLAIGTFSLSLTCVASANDPQCLFFATSTALNATRIRMVSTNSLLFLLASKLDIVVTAPPGPSPTASNREVHYHYQYSDRRRVYYQNINSNNSQSTTYSGCFNDHSTRVYKGQRYVCDANSDSATGSNNFSNVLSSHLNLNFLN